MATLAMDQRARRRRLTAALMTEPVAEEYTSAADGGAESAQNDVTVARDAVHYGMRWLCGVLVATQTAKQPAEHQKRLKVMAGVTPSILPLVVCNSLVSKCFARNLSSSAVVRANLVEKKIGNIRQKLMRSYMVNGKRFF